MMKIVGITGQSGSGKSLLSKYIAEAGIPCINADTVYHSMLTPPSKCLDAIAKAFGNKVLSPDGSLDRATLSAIVFSDERNLDLLNATVLPLVIEKIKEIITELEKLSHTTVAVDAPTLIESGFNEECDLVVSVLAPTDTRVERIMARDGISKEKAIARISAQKNDAFYIAASDVTILNDTNEAQFVREAESLIQRIKAL